MGRVYTFPWDFAGFLLGFIRKRREKTIGMILTIGVATPQGNQGNGRTCRCSPETAGGRGQGLGWDGGRGYLQV